MSRMSLSVNVFLLSSYLISLNFCEKLSWLSSKAVTVFISLLSTHLPIKLSNQASRCTVMSHIPQRNHGKHIILTMMTALPTEEKKTHSVVLSAAMLCNQMKCEGLDRGLWFHSQDLFHGFFLLPFPNLQAASCQSPMHNICLQLEVSAKPLYTLWPYTIHLIICHLMSWHGHLISYNCKA